MKNLSLSKKIYAIVMLLCLGLFVISISSIYQQKQLKDMLDFASDFGVPSIIQTQKIQNDMLVQIINERNYLIHDTAEERVPYVKFFEDRKKILADNIAQKKKLSINENLVLVEKFESKINEFYKLNNEVVSLVDQNKMHEARDLVSKSGRKIRTELTDITNEMNNNEMNDFGKFTTRSSELYNFSVKFVIGMSIAVLIGGLLMSSWMIRDLSAQIKQIIKELFSSSSHLTNTSQSIADSSQELSQAVAQQAASLEETAASIEEMSSMVQKNAKNASSATDTADQSLQSIARGESTVRSMLHAMEEINYSNKNISAQIQESNNQISEIVLLIKEIESKTKVINDIAFQTKLLSFNASVEAARAGEQGKGFAVVAEEVGNLAQMSDISANEISQLLDSSVKKVEDIVNTMKTSVDKMVKVGSEKVSEGIKIAEECRAILQEIVGNSSEVKKMASDIATACNEQAIGVQEITKAMNQLDQVTQINSTSSSDCASASHGLSQQAEQLRVIVYDLIKAIEGSDGEKSVRDDNVHVIQKRSDDKKYNRVA